MKLSLNSRLLDFGVFNMLNTNKTYKTSKENTLAKDYITDDYNEPSKTSNNRNTNSNIHQIAFTDS